MSFAEEGRHIAEAVRQTFADAGLPWPPESAGPVPLDRLIGAYPLVHEEVPGLSHAVASTILGRWGVRRAGPPQPDASLAGFIYANARSGYIFVRRDDALPRRRFTAAHELGHFRLHLTPALAQRDPDTVEIVQVDEDVAEADEGELTAMERQANRFAAELLMPGGVCHVLHEQCSRKYGAAARFAVHHLANELLVSREAIAWRLFGLGLIERPQWLAKGKGRDAHDAGRETAEAV